MVVRKPKMDAGTTDGEEGIELFIERLRDLAENWRFSDEVIGLVVRRRWPQRYDLDSRAE